MSLKVWKLWKENHIIALTDPALLLCNQDFHGTEINSRKVSLFSRACWFNMGSTFLLPAFMIVQFSSVLCTSFVGSIHIKNFLYLKDLFLFIGMFNFLSSIKHNPKHFSFSTRLKFFRRPMLYIYRFCCSLF